MNNLMRQLVVSLVLLFITSGSFACAMMHKPNLALVFSILGAFCSVVLLNILFKAEIKEAEDQLKVLDKQIKNLHNKQDRLEAALHETKYG